MSKNFIWKIQRRVRKFKAKLQKKISWSIVLGFASGIVLCSLATFTALYFYSKEHSSSVSETIENLLSFDVEVPDYSRDFGEDYYIEIGEGRRDIFDDYYIEYSLSGKLYEQCRIGFCKIIPEVMLEGDNSYQIAGPSTLLSGEFEQSGEVRILKSSVPSTSSGPEEFDLRIVVRVFNEEGVFVGEVVNS